MDDGDILRPRPPKVVESDFELVSTPGDPKLVLNQSCAGCTDLSHVRSLPESEKRRFCLSRRAQLPSQVARDLLRSSFDDVNEDSVVVLSTMAKCFVVKTIQRVRAGQKARDLSTSNPITVSELRNLNVVELGAI